MKEQTAQHNQVKLPFEVFDMVSEAKNIDDRAAILQQYGTFAIKTILQANFKSSVVFDLPEGTPPYRVQPDVVGMQPRHIEKAIFDLAYLVKGAKKQIGSVKREIMFIKLLETCHPMDAKIIIAMKDKTLQDLYPKLTEALVKKAYPNLI
jgi:hypothetical protein